MVYPAFRLAQVGQRCPPTVPFSSRDVSAFRSALASVPASSRALRRTRCEETEIGVRSASARSTGLLTRGGPGPGLVPRWSTSGVWFHVRVAIRLSVAVLELSVLLAVGLTWLRYISVRPRFNPIHRPVDWSRSNNVVSTLTKRSRMHVVIYRLNTDWTHTYAPGNSQIYPMLIGRAQPSMVL